MKTCKHCDKPYANDNPHYCSRICQIKAIAQRVQNSRGLIHQPGWAMEDREFLFEELGISL